MENKETELLFERIDDLTVALEVLRFNAEQQRQKSTEIIDSLMKQIRELQQMVDRLQLHVAQGVEL